MKVVIIKYNAGNIQSVIFALERLGIQPLVSDQPQELLTADKLIFPGQGEASSAMNYLKEKKLDQLIPRLKQPFLGICLGMQLMCSHSEENDTTCLNIFDEKVLRFGPANGKLLKVPQVGWNAIYQLKGKLFQNVPEGSYVYFLHSFFVENHIHSTATAHYAADFCAAFEKDNFYAVQFHPEKSATIGEIILKNFLK